MFPKYTLILGGAASGKSVFAEQVVERSGKPRIYLATSQLFENDDEMRNKIHAHVARRGRDWTTIEAPFEAAAALETLQSDEVCLLDCATMWLTNHLLAENDLTAKQDQLLDAIANCRANLVLVSNEVGHGIVPGDALSRRFREAQGRLNIALAARAELVVLVVAGLPQVLKGALP
ncbi:MAG: bifunctional adenosylcobinamide kinase/adenosylcobinamide-phosphate guanylyltransferase [Pseudomonadota bacterium]